MVFTRGFNFIFLSTSLSNMTYVVSSGTLNRNSINHCCMVTDWDKIWRIRANGLEQSPGFHQGPVNQH